MKIRDLKELPDDLDLYYMVDGKPTKFVALSIDEANIIEDNGETVILLSTHFEKGKINNN